MARSEADHWEFPHAAPLSRSGGTLIMGIVNMTPDSFSGRNAAPSPREALSLALRMIDDGADCIDIGAESSRPGAGVLGADEELGRLGDVVALLRFGRCRRAAALRDLRSHFRRHLSSGDCPSRSAAGCGHHSFSCTCLPRRL